jgi:hypothetical protein
MKTSQSLIYIITSILFVCSLAGCEKNASESGNQMATQSASGKHIGVDGQVKVVLVRGKDFSFTVHLFLVAEPNVYHLTFDPQCAAEGGSDSVQDGDGFPMVIGGKHFLIHSGATYRVSGVQSAKDTVLSTRPTIPLLVNKLACVTKGTGTSYAAMGWDGKSTTWAPPESANGILVNDSEMTIRVEDGRLNMGGGGKTIDINSVAAWAKEP